MRACKRDDQQCADDCRSQCKLVFIVDFDDGSVHLLSDWHCSIITCERQSAECITELGPDVCKSERGSDNASSDGNWRDVRSVDVSYVCPAQPADDSGSDAGSDGSSCSVG